jgi:exodeoxyribonuclease VII small subunit
MPNFEEKLTSLEGVVERLERGDLSLDESVKLFEEGMKLSTACREELEQAEGRIKLLVEGPGAHMHATEISLGEETEPQEGEE